MTRTSTEPADSEWWWIAGVVCLALSGGPNEVGDEAPVEEDDDELPPSAVTRLTYVPNLARVSRAHRSAVVLGAGARDRRAEDGAKGDCGESALTDG